MTKRIIDRVYPYDVPRKCPICKEYFTYSVTKPYQAKEYPRCSKCFGVNSKSRSTDDHADSKTKKQSRKEMFASHDEACIVYRQLLIKHKRMSR